MDCGNEAHSSMFAAEKHSSYLSSPGQQYGLPVLDTTIVLSGTLTNAYSIIDPINFSVRCHVCGVILHGRALFSDHLDQKQHLDNHNYARAHPQQTPPNMPAEGFGPPLSRPPAAPRFPGSLRPLAPAFPTVRLPWQRPFLPRQPQRFGFPVQPGPVAADEEMRSVTPCVTDVNDPPREVSDPARAESRSASALSEQVKDMLAKASRTPSTLLKNHRGEAVIGVEYLLEVTGGENLSEYYICMMCCRWMPRRQEAILHLCSPTHRLTYLDRYFPRAFRRLGEGVNSGRQRWTSVTFSQLGIICRRIEQKFGRLHPIPIAHGDLHTHPIAIRRQLDQMEHHREGEDMDYSDLLDPFSGCWLSAEDTPTLTIGDVVLLTESTIKLCSSSEIMKLKGSMQDQVHDEISRFRKKVKAEQTTSLDSAASATLLKRSTATTSQKSTTTTSTAAKSSNINNKTPRNNKCENSGTSGSGKSSYFEAARQKAKLRGEVTSSDSEVEVLSPPEPTQRHLQTKGCETNRRGDGFESDRTRSVRSRPGPSESSGRRDSYSSASESNRHSHRGGPRRRKGSRSPSPGYSSGSSSGHGRRPRPSRYRERSPYRERRSPGRDRRSTGRESSLDREGRSPGRDTRSPGDLADRLAKFRRREHVMQDRLEQQKRVFDRRPEDHPRYREEWCCYWERRHAELLKQGADPDSFDFIPGWKLHWQEFTSRLYVGEREERRAELLRFYRLVEVDGRIVDQKQQETALAEQQPSPPADRNTDSTTSRPAGSQSEAAGDPELSQPGHVPADLSSVLRMLAALEDQLGSFAGATNQLLCRTVAAERRAAGSSRHLLHVPAHALLLEMVRAKLEGQLSAGVLTATAEASRRALVLLTRLLHEVPAHVFAPPLTAAQIAEQVAGLSASLLARDSLSVSRHIACELARMGQTGISDDDLTKVLIILLKPTIVNRNRDERKVGFTSSATPSVEECDGEIKSSKEPACVTPLFNAYSDNPVKQSASSKSRASCLDKEFDYDSHTDEEEVVCLDSTVAEKSKTGTDQKRSLPSSEPPMSTTTDLQYSDYSFKHKSEYSPRQQIPGFSEETSSNAAWTDDGNPIGDNSGSTSAAREAQWTEEDVPDPASEPDDELSVEQIYSLLQNFDSLNRAEQEKLMEYLRSLEVNQSEKVAQLKTLLNRKPIRSLVNDRMNEPSEKNSANVGPNSSRKESSNDNTVNKEFGGSSTATRSSVLVNKEKSTQPPVATTAVPFDISLISKEAVDAALNIAEQLKHGSIKANKGLTPSDLVSLRAGTSSLRSGSNAGPSVAGATEQHRPPDPSRSVPSEKLESSSPQPMDLESEDDAVDEYAPQNGDAAAGFPVADVSDVAQRSDRSLPQSHYQLPPGFKPIGGGASDNNAPPTASPRYRQSELSGSHGSSSHYHRGSGRQKLANLQNHGEHYSEFSHNKHHGNLHDEWSHGESHEDRHDEWSHSKDHGDLHEEWSHSEYHQDRHDEWSHSKSHVDHDERSHSKDYGVSHDEWSHGKGHGDHDERSDSKDHGDRVKVHEDRNSEWSHDRGYDGDRIGYSFNHEDQHREWSQTQGHRGHRAGSSQGQGRGGRQDGPLLAQVHGGSSHNLKDREGQDELYHYRGHEEFQHGRNQHQGNREHRQYPERGSGYDVSRFDSSRGRGDGASPRGVNWRGRGRGMRPYDQRGRGHAPPSRLDPNSAASSHVSQRGFRGRGGSFRGAGEPFNSHVPPRKGFNPFDPSSGSMC